jgi:hypothetical protein
VRTHYAFEAVGLDLGVAKYVCIAYVSVGAHAMCYTTEMLICVCVICVCDTENVCICASVCVCVYVCVLGVRGLSQTGEQVNLRLLDTWNKITLP